jgi:hypothetical protein
MAGLPSSTELPRPGIAHLGQFQYVASGRAVVLTRYGTVEARHNLNRPVRFGSDALVMQRNGVWFLLEVYP